jgi:uridine kinase
MSPDETPIVIGIAGGSGSGKTTVANVILQRVGSHRIASLPHDSYYRDLSSMPFKQRITMNMDHPDMFETDLLIEHIRRLKQWQPVNLPVYDYTTYTRTGEAVRVEPQRVILVEGILIFVDQTLRQLMDIKIFVDTDADLRFIRRLKRDIAERGRTTERVIEQYLSTVRPMHLDFVEPSKRYADVIIPEGGLNTVALDMVTARIEAMLSPERHPDK